MWGYEGEELDDIEATIKHVSTSKPDIFFTTVSYPIKGTPYYTKVSDRLVQLKPLGRQLRSRDQNQGPPIPERFTATQTSCSRMKSNSHRLAETTCCRL